MKYLLIKYTIGGVLFISQVSGEFIASYEILNGRNRLINVIDRKQNLQIHAVSLIKNICNNRYSEGWSATGISKNTISKNYNFNKDQLGQCLKIDYKNSSTGIVDDEFETNKVEIYISKNHPLVTLYCTINNEIDWRILNNNPTIDHQEFPFLIHSYIEHNGEITSIFKVIEFKELEFSIEEYRLIKDLVGRAN